VLEMLARLVERSLVLVEEASAGVRYRLLETVREYAAEQLVAAERDAEVVRRTHRDWYLALAEAAAAEMVGRNQAVWLRRLEAEHDNLCAALEWTIDRADTEPGLRLGAALWRFWFNRGHFAEGRRWLEQLVALPGAEVPSRALSTALFGAGTLALEQTDFAAARVFADRTLAVSQTCGYSLLIAAAWLLRGNVERGRGRYTAARRHYETALELFGSCTDTELVNESIAITLGALGHVAQAEGDYVQARAYYHAALPIEREHGQRKDMANLLYRLGEVALEEGVLGEARTLFGESLRLAHEIGDRQRLAYLLEGFAALAAAEQLPRRATLLAGAAARLRGAIGSPLPGPERDRLRRRLGAATRAADHEVRSAR
jgi:tetratricopeptide (TPR) repeat protein